eukprot:1346433-Prymnesium_polylepis.2
MALACGPRLVLDRSADVFLEAVASRLEELGIKELRVRVATLRGASKPGCCLRRHTLGRVAQPKHQ